MRVLLSLVALGIVALVVGWFQLNDWSKTEIDLAEPVLLVVEPGEALQPISLRLEEEGVVDRGWLFEILARFKGLTTSIKVGEYRFVGATSPLDVLRDIVSGNVSHYFLQLPEGETFATILQILSNTPKLEFDLSGVDVRNVTDLLDLPGDVVSGEGLFFPDTYRYEYRETASSILHRASEEMQWVLDLEWDTRTPMAGLDTRYELLILASIVEKESGLKVDRHRISGVLQRRLEKSMFLQVDPTVIYGLGDAFDGDLKRIHLEQVNPYNTYRVKGLPPTPICIPSLEALHAAANPSGGDDLYFVARGDGTSQFSRTLEEHNVAVRKFQLE